jgi:hypothetical protein
MDADVTLDQDHVNILGRVLKSQTTDFMLDNADRLKNSAGFRRAVVHDVGDKLTLNNAGDYPGGVEIQGDQVTVRQLRIANQDLKDTGGRALVQDDQDTLVLNQGGFYKSGVRVEGGSLTATQLRIENPDLAGKGGRALAQDDKGALVINQGGYYTEGVRVEGGSLTATQLRIANPNLQGTGGRALAQSDNGSLVINQGGVYSGGVAIEGVMLSIKGMVTIAKSLNVDTNLVVRDSATIGGVNVVNAINALLDRVSKLERNNKTD